MQYIRPQITNTTKAHVLIQSGSGSKARQVFPDNNIELPDCTNAAYEADE